MGSYSLYRHTSPSGRVYIGITKRKPEYRWNHGKGYCRGDQPLFEKAIIKYGWDNIKHEVLFSGLSDVDAKNLEIQLITHYKSLGISYNINDGGDGGRGNRSHLGLKDSKEVREKKSRAHKGLHAGEKNPNYGRKGEKASAYGKFGQEHPASKCVYQYALDGSFIKKWDCLSDVQRELGFLVTNITAVCKGKGFTLGKFRWSYSFPYVFNPEEKERRDAKRKKLSKRAKDGYKTGKRKKRFGKDNPMYGRRIGKSTTKK